MNKQLTRLLALVILSVAFLGLNRTSAQVLIHYWSFGKGTPPATGPKYNGGPLFYAPWVINSSTPGYYSTPGSAVQVGIILNPGDSMVKADEDLGKLNSKWLHINADYSALDSTKAQISFAARFTASKKTAYANYYTYVDTVASASAYGAKYNLQTTPHGTPNPGEGLRMRNPSDSIEMLLWMPTTGYKNIQFSWEVSNSSPTSGVPAIQYAYSTDSGKTWKTTLWTSTPAGDTIPRYPVENDINKVAKYVTNDKTRDTILDDGNSEWNVKKVNFTADTSVNNKPGFVIRIRTVQGGGTKGKNVSSKGNIRMDNFALKGTPTHLFGSITKLQTGSACVNSTTSALDSCQISFGPAVAYTGSKFTVQLSDSLGSFAASSNIDTFSASSTGSQTLHFHIPAGYYSPTGNYKVRVLYPGVDTFSSLSITNISYSPQNVSSVTTTNGFNTGTITWGIPGGCYYDNILVVVSPKTTATKPSGTTYAASTTYGSGSSLNGGYVVYSGTSVNSPITITNVKNDSTYYVTVYTLYGSTWSKGVRAILAPTPYVPVNYWNFNNTSTWSVSSAVTPSSLTGIRANYSAIDTGLTKITYSTVSGTSSHYTTYYDATTGTNLNSRFSAKAGSCLRLRNPSDSMQVLVAMATTGYKRLKISFDRQNATGGATSLSYDYSTNGGKTWKTSGISTTTDAINSTWSTSPVITFTDTTVNNNPNFVFRIKTANNNTGTSGNFRIDNVALDGVYEGNANKNTTITKLQNGSACITHVISAKDSIYFTYSPKTSVPKGTTFTAQLSDSFGSFASPVTIGTVVSDTSGHQVIVGTIPAATREARNNYIRIVSSVDTSSPKLVENIVYSPKPISFVSATNGNTNSYINWGTPGGCYYDDVVIIVSRNPVSGAPSATTYAYNSIYGHGASLLGGSVVYFGNHINSTYKVTGLKNDSTYYATVYVLKGSEWSTGVSYQFMPTFSQLVHYWDFNNFNSGVTGAISPANFKSVAPDYTLIDTATAKLSYQRLPGTSNHYSTYWASSGTGGTLNDQTLAGIGTIAAGNCVHLPNPVDSMALLLYAPTSGYKNIKFVYEATNSSVPTGVPNAVYSYSTDSGLTWKAVPDTWVTPRPVKAGCDSIIYNSTGLMTLHSVDFTNDTTVGHNPKFVIRITTKVNGVTGINGSNGKGGSTSGGWYVDNFTISGKPLSGSINIASYQSAKVCVTNTVSGLDTIGFYYNPTVNFNGVKFTVQLSEPNGDFITPTTIATVTSNGSGSQKVVATIPAGTKNSSNYEIRVISSVADGTPYGINNIVYSPGEVASLSATGGNNTGIIRFGTPTGCYNDSILVVVSKSTITTSPTVGGRADTVYGHGTAFGGGYVVYKGNSMPDSVTVSGLSNDTTYYAHVFTSYSNVWSEGVETTFIPRATSASMDSATPLTSCSAKTFILPVNFTGLAPWILTYNNGTKDTTITTSSNPYNIVKYTTTTTLYTLKSVYNYGGALKGSIGIATRRADILSTAARSITPSNTTVCAHSSQLFTLGNYNAATKVSWYYNTNPTATSSSWTSFGGNYDTATLSGITANVYVHAIVTATGCAAVSSNDAYVKVDSASKLTVGAIGSTTVALSWTAVVGASSYTVHYGSSSKTVSGTTTTLTGLSACTAYSIYVSPNSSACSVGNSNTVSITTSPAAIALRLDTTGNLIKAHWNGVKGNRYKLYVSQLISLPNSSVFTVSKDTTFTIDLSKSTGYKGNTLLMYVVLDSGSNCSTKPVSNTKYINAKGGTCTNASPGSFTVSTSSNSISLSWTGSSSYYNVYYKTVSGTSWKTYNTSSTNYTLTGLSTNTCYMVFVTNTCSISPFTAGYSTQIDTVCTPKPCATPNNLVLSSPTCHGFTATWNTVSGVSNYSLYYTRTSGVGAPVSFSYRSSTNLYTITSLSPGTSYSLYVRANCSSGAQSLSSNTESTTTKSIGCKDDVTGNSIVSTSSFNVYPNPNNGTFIINMNTTATAQTATVEVMNVLGQLVYANTVASNNGQIIESVDLNSKAAGLYIVRVRCGNDVQDAKVQVTR